MDPFQEAKHGSQNSQREGECTVPHIILTENSSEFGPLMTGCFAWFNKDSQRVCDLESMLFKKRISLRLIHFFVVRYSQKIPISKKHVWTDYRRNLNHIGKHAFDIFCRGRVVEVSIHGRVYTTSIGQLHFFRWFLSRQLHEYVCDHEQDIRRELRVAAVKRLSKKKEKPGTTRSENVALEMKF